MEESPPGVRRLGNDLGVGYVRLELVKLGLFAAKGLDFYHRHCLVQNSLGGGRWQAGGPKDWVISEVQT